jgi:hypothetical protein
MDGDDLWGEDIDALTDVEESLMAQAPEWLVGEPDQNPSRITVYAHSRSNRLDRPFPLP